jgi:hypothetical protein
MQRRRFVARRFCVIGEPRDVWFAEQGLGECGQCSAVQGQAAERLERLLDREPRELVAKLDCACALDQHPGREALLQCGHLPARQGLEQPELDPGRGDRDRVQQHTSVVGQAGGSRKHRVPDRRRDGGVAGGEHFGDVEGVAAGQPVQVGRVHIGCVGELGDRLRREWRDRQPPHVRLRAELAEDDPERMHAIELVVAVGGDQEQRRLSELAPEQANHVEGGLVGPVDVLDDRDRRRTLPCHPEQRGRNLGRPLLDRGLQVAAARLGDVEERPQRPGREQRVAAAPEHRRRCSGLVAERADCGRLADAGLADHEDQPAVPLARLFQGVAQRVERRLALEQAWPLPCRSNRHAQIVTASAVPINPRGGMRPRAAGEERSRRSS